MKKYTIKTMKDTGNLAEKIAGQLKGGEVIGFIGNLGAGKTTFIQYLAKYIGVKQTVNSPTFNIIKVYKIKNSKIKNFTHIDAYRLNSADELRALGVEEFVDNPKTITVIEWADKVGEILPKDAIVIKIKLNKDGSRVFEIKMPR
ncbi:MAG: tRNA (adenosine(37)-N6)-threonylcarbamoyltransferase complex ATPase subunit type 1 TsaE [Patescibacteria group bacterium]|jgi:tRNA threonylcarbamoyladenosine biosynthesis protein TsaE